MRYVLQSTFIFIITSFLVSGLYAQRNQLLVDCPDDFIKEECCAAPTEDPFYGIAMLELPTVSTICARQNIIMFWLREDGNIPISPNNIPTVEGFMTHDISILVSDACGNSDTCTYSITITRPSLTFEFDPCPSDTIIYVVPGETGAVVEYEFPEFDSNCPLPTNISITPEPLPMSGSIFPLGTTAFSFLATNATCGEALCEFNIIVEESEISVACPEDILKEENFPEAPFPEFGTAVIAVPTVSTTCPLGSELTITLLDEENYILNADGTRSVTGFQTHIIRFEVSDLCGDTAICSYEITITRPDPDIRFLDCPTDTIIINLEGDETFAEDVYEIPDVTSNCFEDFEYLGDPANIGAQGPFYPGIYRERYTLVAPCGGESCDIIIDVRVDGPLVEFINCPDDFTKIEESPIPPANDPLYGLARIEVPELFAACEFGQDVIFVAPNDAVTIDGERYVSGFRTHEVLFIGVGNGCGEIDSCSYSITVERPDTILQFIDCQTDTIINVVAGESGAVFNYSNPMVGSNCPGVNLAEDSNNIGSGGFFPIGMSTERFVVTSDCGEIVCEFNVIVVAENVNLTVACPANFMKTEDPISTGQDDYGIAIIQFPAVSTDCPDSVVSIELLNEDILFIDNQPAVQGFQVHDIVFRISDNCGNVEVCTYSIEITRPELIFEIDSCPEDLVLLVPPGTRGAIVNYDEPQINSNCPDDDVALTRISTGAPGNGELFPVGTTTLTYVLSSAFCGNVRCEFTVTVEEDDTLEESEISVVCPEDILKEERFPEAPFPEFGTAVIAVPIASTTCSMGSEVTITLLDEENYILNTDGTRSVTGFQTHIVRFEMSDLCGDTAICSYEITITRPDPDIRFLDCPMDTIIINLEGDETFAENVYEIPDVTSNCFEDFEYLGDPANKGPQGPFYPGIYRERYTLVAPCGGESCDIIIDVRLDGPLVEFRDCPDDFTKTEASPVPPANDPLYGLAKIEVPELFAACEFGQEVIFIAPNDAVTIDGERYVSGFRTHEVLFIGVGNGCGSIDSCSYSITVERPDTILQFIDCQTDTIINVVAGESGAVFNYSNPMVGSNCPGVNLAEDPNNIGSGGFFPIGMSTERFVVTSDCGEIVCEFNVIVVAEDVNLTVDCPANFVKTEDPISTGQDDYGIAIIQFPDATTDCADPTVSIELLNEDILFIDNQPVVQGFQIHDIVFRISDNCGNVEICTYTIEITRPELVFEIGFCPDDLVILVPPGAEGTIVNYDVPQITSNCPDENIELERLPTGAPENGALFPVGTTTLTYVLSSVFCGDISCEFSIIIEEDETMESGIDLELSLETQHTTLERYNGGDFRFVLTNNSAEVATGVEVHLNYDPNEMVPVGNARPVLSKGSYRLVPKRWNIDELGAGETATLDIKMFAKMAGASFSAEVSNADQMDIDSAPNNAVCCEAMEDDEVYFKAGIIEPPFILTCPASFTQEYVLPLSEDDPFFGKAIILFPTAVSTSCADPTVDIELVTTENVSEMNGLPVVEGFQVHEVVFRISDQCGNTELCSYNIKITMPNLFHRFVYCPEDVTINIPSGRSTARVFYPKPIFQTNCSEFILLEASDGAPPNGGEFPIGTTKISYFANSECEIDTCSFNVTVLEENVPAIDLELSLRINRNNINIYEQIPCRFTVYNNSDVAADGVQFKLNIESDMLVQIGNTRAAVSQGDYLDFAGAWTVGTIAPRDSANLWVDLFLAEDENAAIYAQITSADQLDVDSAPSNGDCCIAIEDDEVVFQLEGEFSPDDIKSLDFIELRDPHTGDGIAVYPNPSHSNLNVFYPIESGATNYSIFDLNGRLVKTAALTSNENNISIDISALQNGMYFLVLNAENVQFFRRFVKN